MKLTKGHRINYEDPALDLEVRVNLFHLQGIIDQYTTCLKSRMVTVYQEQIDPTPETVARIQTIAWFNTTNNKLMQAVRKFNSNNKFSKAA